MPPSLNDFAIWSDYLLKLFVATALSGIVGVERQLRKKTAGMRTHMLVCLGSLVFTLLGMDLFARGTLTASGADPTRVDPLRIVEAIVGGLGFLGAGAIIQARGHIHGLTTATSIWTMGALGVAVGIGNYNLALLTMVFTLLVLWTIDLFERKFIRPLAENKKGVGSEQRDLW